MPTTSRRAIPPGANETSDTDPIHAVIAAHKASIAHLGEMDDARAATFCRHKVEAQAADKAFNEAEGLYFKAQARLLAATPVTKAGASVYAAYIFEYGMGLDAIRVPRDEFKPALENAFGVITGAMETHSV